MSEQFTAISLSITRIAFIVTGVFMNVMSHAQKLDSSFRPLLGELENEIPQILDSAHIPGMSIAVIDKGEIIWNKGFGLGNVESGLKVVDETIFPAASLGKPVFAYAILKLADEGNLYLDSAVLSSVPVDYLEKTFFKGKVEDEKIKLITPRMILSHSSGLPNWRTPGEPLKTFFEPGTKYSYSGEGYYLLQLMVEYIMKQPLETLMTKTVFEPLAMHNSTYLPNAGPHTTVSYGNDGKRFTESAAEVANVAHSFKSTATDYSRFIIAAMNGKGLAKGTLKEMFSPQITTDICQSGQVSWGLGFALQQTDKGNTFFQWGKSPNASSYVIGFRDSKRALVYFTNIANQGLRIGEVLVRKTLNHEDRLFSCFGVKQYNK